MSKPRLASYRGDGPLESWVAVASIRLAVSMGRSVTAERRLRTKAIAGFVGTNPELLVMKGQLRSELESAVARALGQLDEGDRLLLRLYVVSGMTLTAIGRTLGVSPKRPCPVSWRTPDSACSTKSAKCSPSDSICTTAI